MAGVLDGPLAYDNHRLLAGCALAISNWPIGLQLGLICPDPLLVLILRSLYDSCFWHNDAIALVGGGCSLLGIAVSTSCCPISTQAPLDFLAGGIVVPCSPLASDVSRRKPRLGSVGSVMAASMDVLFFLQTSL